MRLRLLAAAALALLILDPSAARADCTSPAGPEGRIEYINAGDEHVFKYCNGADWIPWAAEPLTAIPPPAGGGGGATAMSGLTDVDVTGVADGECLVYNNSTSKWEDGSCGSGGDNLGDHTATQALDMATFSITNVADPSAAQDAVTKAYVDGLTGANETDPQVGTLTSNLWCAANAGGTAIDCTQSAPGVGADSLDFTDFKDAMALDASTDIAVGANTLAITNDGAGTTFRVNDNAASDTSPFIIDSAGRVGIGTSVPQGGLSLGVQALAAAPAYTYDFATNQGLIEFYQDSSQSYRRFLDIVAQGHAGNPGAGGTIRFLNQTTTSPANVSETMRIDQTGRVGIATPSPGATLDVLVANYNTGLKVTGIAGVGAGAGLHLDSSAGTGGRKYVLISTANTAGAGQGKLSVWDETASAYRMVIDSVGNVGIGTTGPQSLLQVANTGYAQFSKSFAGAPSGIDCDNAAEAGRVTFDTTNSRWYLCDGSGWIYASMGTSGGAGDNLGDHTATSILYLNGNSLITANPPAAGSNVGWKVGLWGNTYALGIANYTVAAKTAGWLSVFSGNPANDGTAGVPDSNAKVSLNGANGNGVFTGTITANAFSGSGASLTTLNAGNLGSGTVPLARLGASGTPSTSTFLRGDNTWQTPSISETDPQVNATTNNLWCRGTGTQVTCDQAAPSAGTPGGANTQVQFNNSSAFGGSANLTWNNTTRTLAISSAASGLTAITSSTTNANAAIFGYATGVSGEVYGVAGASISPDGYGVAGEGANNGSGVYGSVVSGTGAGVYGYTSSDDTDSVAVYADGGPYGTGVYATGNVNNPAVYAGGTSDGMGLIAEGGSLALLAMGNVRLSENNSYINFGATTGSGGYGFRDNAGTIEVKNSGGSWAAPGAGGGPGMKSMQVFTANDTWNRPAGVTRIMIKVVGGGGNGGSSAGFNTGAGGGGGATCIKFIDVSAIPSVAVTVGGAASNSSFGAHCTAAGGTNASAGTGGTGGTASGGDLNMPGEDGANAGGATTGSPGTFGGSSTMGFGGKGGTGSTAPDRDGSPGKGYGAGGGGGAKNNPSSGGAGAPGIVWVQEY